MYGTPRDKLACTHVRAGRVCQLTSTHWRCTFIRNPRISEETSTFSKAVVARHDHTDSIFEKKHHLFEWFFVILFLVIVNSSYIPVIFCVCSSTQIHVWNVSSKWEQNQLIVSNLFLLQQEVKIRHLRTCFYLQSGILLRNRILVRLKSILLIFHLDL